MIGTAVVTRYGCERCQHVWTPRGKAAPLVCPKCKSPYWNSPRKATLPA